MVAAELASIFGHGMEDGFAELGVAAADEPQAEAETGAGLGVWIGVALTAAGFEGAATSKSPHPSSSSSFVSAGLDGTGALPHAFWVLD